MRERRKRLEERRAIVFTNGRVLTLDGTTEAVEALVVHGGLVVGSGTTSDMLHLAGADAKRIDLLGATLMPGLIDTHPHLLHFFGRTNSFVDLSDVTSHFDIISRIRARANKTPPGRWILCTPVGEPYYFIRRSYRDLAEKELPKRDVLDRATADHPVIIQAYTPVTPNVCALNSLGLERLNITRESPDRIGNVWIEKDATGRPTGILRGSVTTLYNNDPIAKALVSQLPQPTRNDFLEGTRRGMPAYNALGVTTVYEAHNISPEQIGVYRQLRNQGDLSVRVLLAPEAEIYIYPWNTPLSMDELNANLEQALAMVDLSDEMLRVNGVTITCSGPAWPGMMIWHEPYKGPYGEPTTGVWVISQEKVSVIMKFCAERGLRFNVCAVGLAEHDFYLKILEELAAHHDIRSRHWIIQHNFFLGSEHARRYAALGFVATTSISFSWGKGDMFIERIGEHALKDLIPLKRYLDAGIPVACGSDWGPKNIFEQMELAVSHRFCGSGRTNRGPAQGVTREEALMMWTRDAAKVLGWERIGTLSQGNHADLIVIDRDPLNCDLDVLPRTRIVLTMLGGKIVYDTGELNS